MQLTDVISCLPAHSLDAVVIAAASGDEGGSPSVVWCNAAFTEMTGYAAEELIGATPRILHGPETDRGTIRAIQRSLQVGRPVRAQVKNYRKDGTTFWVDLSINPICDEAGALRYWVSIQRNATVLKETEEALLRARREAEIAQQRLVDALEALPEAFVLYDKDDRLVLCNSKYRDVYRESAPVIRPGAAFETIIRYGVERGQYADAVGREDAWLTERLAEHRGSSGPIEQALPGDRHLLIHEVRTRSGDTCGFRVDVTELRRKQREVEAYARALGEANEVAELRALTDPLTGLWNRRALDSHLEELSRIEDATQRIALLHIDLDGFKAINDTFGHAAGDFVIRHVAGILRSSVRDADFVARVGGDEFVVVCVMRPKLRSPEALANRLIQSLRTPIQHGKKVYRVTTSIGIASAKPAYAKRLLGEADVALYRAKAHGKNCSARFSRAIRSELAARKRLADEIAAGLESGEFEPHYQPQVDARTWQLVGVEALARWRHPRHGVLAPDAFIQVAEDANLIGDIDHVIFTRATEELRALANRGVTIPKLSVNVSFRRLSDPRLVSDLERMIGADMGVCLELHESIFFDTADQNILQRLADLKAKGASIEIDDFGTGRASITGLLKVEPNGIKIDRELVQPILGNAKQRGLVEAIVSLGRSMSIQITAEGVETLDHANLLGEMGCDTLQGYAFGRPMPAEALVHLSLPCNFWSDADCRTAGAEKRSLVCDPVKGVCPPAVPGRIVSRRSALRASSRPLGGST